jgi:hypothetical protein
MVLSIWYLKQKKKKKEGVRQGILATVTKLILTETESAIAVPRKPEPSHLQG